MGEEIIENHLPFKGAISYLLVTICAPSLVKKNFQNWRNQVCKPIFYTPSSGQLVEMISDAELDYFTNEVITRVSPYLIFKNIQTLLPRVTNCAKIEGYVLNGFRLFNLSKLEKNFQSFW